MAQFGLIGYTLFQIKSLLYQAEKSHKLRHDILRIPGPLLQKEMGAKKRMYHKLQIICGRVVRF